MKKSGQSDMQLQLHRNNLYLQTESCTLWNTKPDGRDSGFVEQVHLNTKRQVTRKLLVQYSRLIW